MGGPIALLQDGDRVTIDATSGELSVALSDAELAERRKSWTERSHDYQAGVLWKYAATVGPAYQGAVTHPGARRKPTASRTFDGLPAALGDDQG